MNKIKIKICGLTRKKDIKNVLKYNIDAIGFIFYKKSKRYLNLKKAKNIIKNIPSFISIIGVFVNEKIKEIYRILKNIPISIIQFHGKESIDYCCKIANIFKIPFIKTIHMEKKFIDLIKINNKLKSKSIFFSNLLLDNKNKNNYGGTGKNFNWNKINKNIRKYIILSGGINKNNIIKVFKKIKPYAVDINSSLEKTPGIKDKKKIKTFMKLIKNYNNDL